MNIGKRLKRMARDASMENAAPLQTENPEMTANMDQTKKVAIEAPKEVRGAPHKMTTRKRSRRRTRSHA